MLCLTYVTTWSLMVFLANLPWAGGKSQVVLWPWTESFRSLCLPEKKSTSSEGILINYHFWYFNESICTGPKDVQINESDMPSNKVYRHVQIPPAESMWLQDCKDASWNILPALHSVLSRQSQSQNKLSAWACSSGQFLAFNVFGKGRYKKRASLIGCDLVPFLSIHFR